MFKLIAAFSSPLTTIVATTGLLHYQILTGLGKKYPEQKFEFSPTFNYGAQLPLQKKPCVITHHNTLYDIAFDIQPNNLTRLDICLFNRYYISLTTLAYLDSVDDNNTNKK